MFSGISDYVQTCVAQMLSHVWIMHMMTDDDGKEGDVDDIDNNYENCPDDHDQWCSANMNGNDRWWFYDVIIIIDNNMFICIALITQIGS